MSLGGLYLEGLIHGGAYFRNFTVFHCFRRSFSGLMIFFLGGGGRKYIFVV